jgi:hypothetical protein
MDFKFRNVCHRKTAHGMKWSDVATHLSIMLLKRAGTSRNNFWL